MWGDNVSAHSSRQGHAEAQVAYLSKRGPGACMMMSAPFRWWYHNYEVGIYDGVYISTPWNKLSR